MIGKQKCRILREIRQQIARENDINLVIEECTHKGECRGTCPRCEAEVRYLEQELEKRRQLHKRVALVGISAGMTLALSGCSAIEQVIENLPTAPAPTEEIFELQGDVPYDPEDSEELILDGEVGPDDYAIDAGVTPDVVVPKDYVEPDDMPLGEVMPSDFPFDSIFGD